MNYGDNSGISLYKTAMTQFAPHQQRVSRCVTLSCHIGLTALVLLFTGMFFQPVIVTIVSSYPETVSIRSVAILSIGLLFLYKLAVLKTQPFHFAQFNGIATMLLLVSALLFLFIQRYFALQAVSQALFIVFCFALSGHFINRATWQANALPLIIIVLMLPFEGYLDVLIGFPLRVFSSELAANVLQHIPVGANTLSAISSSTILLIENRAAVVDVDCSGIKSLWLGAIFFCGMTWIERYRLSYRWLCVAAVYAAVLIISNVLRIVILVFLDLVLDLPHIAHQFHLTLGLIGFSLSALFGWFLLKQCVSTEQIVSHSHISHAAAVSVGASVDSIGGKKSSHFGNVGQPSAWLNMLPSVVLVSLIVSFVFLYQPAQVIQSSDIKPVIDTAGGFQLNEVPLNESEQRYFSIANAQANKYSVINANTQVEDGAGAKLASVITVWSRDWAAQHQPDNCYLAQGYFIDNSGVELVSGNMASSLEANNIHVQNAKKAHPVMGKEAIFPIKSLALSMKTHDKPIATRTKASYWFQSSIEKTADYSTRVFDQIAQPHREWVMVSILWNSTTGIDQQHQVIQAVSQAIGKQF